MEPRSRNPSHKSPPPEASELPERWSAQRKTEVILRLLRGESLDAVSRESQVPAHELESWHRTFVEAGARGLKRHTDPDERELLRTRAKLGEMMMRLELAEDLLEKKGYGEELRKRRP
jgi:transposase